MENILLLIFASFILSVFQVYCWNRLEANNITFKLFASLVLLISAFTNLSNYFFEQPIRIIFVTSLLIFLNNVFISKNIKKAIIQVCISQIILALVETSFVIAGSLIFGNKIDSIMYEPIAYVFLNIYTLILSIFISRTKIIYMVYSLFCDNNKLKTIIYPLLVIITMVIATIESHFDLPFGLILTINILMSIVFVAILIINSRTDKKYERINRQYQISTESLKEYEVMIDKFRLSTHENKNELQTIRNMTKDKNVIKYIDTLIDNKIKDNVKIMKKTAKIPEGGLRATIYSKLCLMDTKKIKYKLIISRDVHTTDLINLNEELVLKICKILGVFLDNAIEAVKSLKKKEISIEIYIMDKNLCIDITNNYKGNLDLSKISEIKYTTKGKGHGYGLALVNKIIKEENNLENERCINGDTFTQTLKIKM